MISAARYAPKSTTRRGRRPEETPLYELSKGIADQMYEDAVRLAEALAPDHPADTDELDEFDQFNILMAASVDFSPGYWNEPEALEDLYRLKKKFTGRDDAELLELAKVARVQRENLPPKDMTPANPEWKETVEKVAE